MQYLVLSTQNTQYIFIFTNIVTFVQKTVIVEKKVCRQQTKKTKWQAWKAINKVCGIPIHIEMQSNDYNMKYDALLPLNKILFAYYIALAIDPFLGPCYRMAVLLYIIRTGSIKVLSMVCLRACTKYGSVWFHMCRYASDMHPYTSICSHV